MNNSDNNKYDILIFSGQSNMQGQTEAPMSNKPLEAAFEYRYLTDELKPLCHPVGEDIDEDLLAAHEGHGSLIPDFCRAYTEETDRRIVAVHVSKGNTRIDEWLPECSRFSTLLNKCRAAINKIGKENIGKIWFIWLQGESDAIHSTSAKDYKERLRLFKNEIEREIKLDGFFFIRVGKFVGDERDIVIIKAQEELSETEDFTMLTRITGYCTNEHDKWINPFVVGHYNNAAMELIGKTAGKNLGLYANGIPFSLEKEPYPEVK